MALGATQRGVLCLVLRESLSVVLVGAAIGVGLAIASTRLVSGFLYGLTGRDPATIAITTVLLLSTAALAAYLKARGAARVDPLIALRWE